MTTPERSIEEIVEEYYPLHCHTVQGVPMHSTQTALGEIDWLRQTLQAERQKRDEMVEAERKRICNELDEMWSALYGAYLNSHDLRELIKNVIIQPNNPK